MSEKLLTCLFPRLLTQEMGTILKTSYRREKEWGETSWRNFHPEEYNLFMPFFVMHSLQVKNVCMSTWINFTHAFFQITTHIPLMLLLFASYWSLLNLECPSWLFLLKCQHFKSLLIQKHFFTIVNILTVDRLPTYLPT